MSESDFSSPGTANSCTLQGTPTDFEGDNVLPPFKRGKRSIPRIKHDSDNDEDDEEILNEENEYKPLAIKYSVCISDFNSSIWKIVLLLEKVLSIVITIHSINITSYLWILFPIYCILSYIILSLTLHKIIKKKFESKYYDLNSILMTISYFICAPIICIFVDFYIFIYYIINDFSDSRYICYYWNAKIFIWTIFVSLPTLITTFIIYSTESIISIILFITFIYNIINIYLQKPKKDISIFKYILRFHLLNDTILPYKNAIIYNRIETIRIHEPLTNIEWRKLVDIFDKNISIKKFNISYQIIPHKLFQIVFKSLITNNLTEIYLVDCNLFSSLSQLNKHKIRLSAIDIKSRSRSDDMSDSRPTMTGFVNKMQEVGEIRNVKVALLQLLSVGTLKILNLRGNCIAGMFDDMINGIILNKELEKLYLGNNSLYINSLSEISITKLFQNCKFLMSLDLSENGLTDKDMKVFINSLTKLSEQKDVETAQYYVQHFQYLDIENNKITKMKPIYKFSRMHGNIDIAFEGNDIDQSQYSRMRSMIGVNALMNEMIGS